MVKQNTSGTFGGNKHNRIIWRNQNGRTCVVTFFLWLIMVLVDEELENKLNVASRELSPHHGKWMFLLRENVPMNEVRHVPSRNPTWHGWILFLCSSIIFPAKERQNSCLR